MKGKFVGKWIEVWWAKAIWKPVANNHQPRQEQLRSNTDMNFKEIYHIVLDKAFTFNVALNTNAFALQGSQTGYQISIMQQV